MALVTSAEHDSAPLKITQFVSSAKQLTCHMTSSKLQRTMPPKFRLEISNYESVTWLLEIGRRQLKNAEKSEHTIKNLISWTYASMKMCFF